METVRSKIWVSNEPSARGAINFWILYGISSSKSNDSSLFVGGWFRTVLWVKQSSVPIAVQKQTWWTVSWNSGARIGYEVWEYTTTCSSRTRELKAAYKAMTTATRTPGVTKTKTLENEDLRRKPNLNFRKLRKPRPQKSTKNRRN